MSQKKRRGSNNLPADPANVPIRQGRPSNSAGLQYQEFRAEIYQGALPHPDHLERFEQLSPGATARFLTLAEKQAEHRQSIEGQVVGGNLRAQQHGVHWAGGIVITGMLAGAWLHAQGFHEGGYFSMFTPLGGVAALFLYTRWRDSRKIAKKLAAERDPQQR